MVDDLRDQLQCCDFDLPAGQMHALPDTCEGPWIRTASLKARKGVCMDAVTSGSIECIETIVQYNSTPTTVSLAMVDYFFPSASRC